MENSGWVGFDLDGTLAKYETWNGGVIGEPVPAMVEKVREFTLKGVECRIVTARVSHMATPLERHRQTTAIVAWCHKHLGFELAVVCEKDFGMWALYDDRAVAVEKNTGRILGGSPS